jgi:flagellar FliL protein
MAEDKTPAEETEDSSGKKSGKLAWVGVGLVAGGLGFATPYFLPEGMRPAAKAEEPVPESAVPLRAAQARPAYIDFGEVVVNLDEGRLNRYLRVSMTLQVDELQVLEITQKVDTSRAVLKSWLLSYLSDKDMEEIRGAAGQNRLRREIQDHFNTVLFPDGYDRIHEVLFQEFNIQ